jgi:hypothetical protein
MVMTDQPRRRPRRVTTAPAPGSDPTPQAVQAPIQLSAEDDERRWGETTGPNDDRLKADKPPHY